MIIERRKNGSDRRIRPGLLRSIASGLLWEFPKISFFTTALFIFTLPGKLFFYLLVFLSAVEHLEGRGF